MTDSPVEASFTSAAYALKTLFSEVRDDQLDAPTPCEKWTVGDLLDHLMGLTVGFRLAAEKAADPVPGGPAPSSVANLDPQWRSRLPVQLDELVAAWRDPAAWEGESALAGLTLRAEVMGVVALDELVVHGWDLAHATGQPYAVAPHAVETVYELVSRWANGDRSPFGPPVTLPDDAPLLDRVIGLTGRDPAWTSPRTA